MSELKKYCDTDRPFFSVCIPQHNRTSFLLKALKSLEEQEFKNFEVCISDDASDDGREDEIQSFLKQSSMNYVYKKQKRNLRYDANLRAALGLSSGIYCFLLGNDDAIYSTTTLSDLHQKMNEFDNIGVVITNYFSENTGKEFHRIPKTLNVGTGVEVAVNKFRNFSFLSGCLLDGNLVRNLPTSKWDGSEMYQMYLGCCIIAGGRNLLDIDMITIREGVQVPGELVNSVIRRPKVSPCTLQERALPMNKIGKLVYDAVISENLIKNKQKIIRKIIGSLYLYTYTYWIFEYRKIQSWKYAFGVCLGMRPKNVLPEDQCSVYTKLSLTALYICITSIGLVVPNMLFFKFYPLLYKISKSNKRMKLWRV